MLVVDTCGFISRGYGFELLLLDCWGIVGSQIVILVVDRVLSGC